MFISRRDKKTHHKGWSHQRSPLTISGHGVGLGITAIAILIFIAMVYNVQEGSLNE